MNNRNRQADILGAINDSLSADSARNAFPRNAEVGDQISGTIADVERRHRGERDTGRPLYWLKQRPQADQVTNRPVYDDILLVQTDLQADEEDAGLRRVWIDNGVKEALKDALGRADSQLEIGGRIDGLMLVGADDRGRRVYNCERYVTAEQAAQATPAQAGVDYAAMAGVPGDGGLFAQGQRRYPQASAPA